MIQKNALPVRDSLVLYSSAVVPVGFPLDTEENVTGWVFQGYAFNKAAPGIAIVFLLCSFDEITKVITVTYDPAEVTAALGAELAKDVSWVLYGKGMAGNVVVPFYTGNARLIASGPECTL